MTFWNPLRRKAHEADLDRELRFHTEERIADLIRSGLTEPEARRLVRLEFGGLDQVKEVCRDARRIRWIENLQQDLRYTARMMRKNPAFSAGVIALLALGIGANTAVFSIVDAVLLRPSPYASPDTLVRIEETSSTRVLRGVPAKHYQRWAGRPDVFEHIAPYIRDTETITGEGEPEQVIAVRSQRLLPALGVAAALGRALTPADDEPGAAHVAVLSHRLWRRRYQGDPNVIGRALTISGSVYSIVGVMPPDFEFHYADAELWVPLRLTPNSPWLQVAARLRPGVSAPQAQGALEAIARELSQEAPNEYAALKINVKTWRDTPDEKYKSTLLFVLVAVGLIMLLVCANVGTLLLSRAIQRQREISIRASLGAGLWRIAGQLLCESLVLALLGSAVGLFVAQSLLTVLTKQLAALPIVLPHLQRVALDSRTLGYGIVLCLVAAVLCSLAPILLATRTGLQSVLRSGQAVAAPKGAARLFSTLIALEAAFAFLLLIGSGLMIRSLLHLQREDHGFRPDHVLTLRVPVGTFTQPRPNGKYDTRPLQMAFYRQILESVQSVPGIKAVAIVNNLPLSGISSSLSFNLRGPDGKAEPTSARTISPRYFAAMGIPLLVGRDFAESDQKGAPDVAIINEYLARQLFPHKSPLGESLTPGATPPGPTIVGVVKDSSQTSYESPAGPEVYIPYQQFMFATFMSTIVVRTEGEPTALAAALRRRVWAVDPNQPVVLVQTMEEVVANSIWRPRFSVWIFSVLSGLSMILTAAGVYAIVANTSALRAHEMGIRLALGAQASDVLLTLLRAALIPLLWGLALATVAGLLLSRLLTNLLYGVSATDPFTYGTAAALLVAIGAAASARPAWRATTQDPLRSLRAE